MRKPKSSNIIPQRKNFVKSVRKQYGNPDSRAFILDHEGRNTKIRSAVEKLGQELNATALIDNSVASILLSFYSTRETIGIRIVSEDDARTVVFRCPYTKIERTLTLLGIRKFHG